MCIRDRAYVLWHLLRKFNKYAEVCDKKSDGVTGLYEYTKFSGWNNRYLVGVRDAACEGSTFEPLIQPILMVILAACATIAVLWYLFRVLFASRFKKSK